MSPRPVDCEGRIFFISLFALLMSLVSLDKSPKKKPRRFHDRTRQNHSPFATLFSLKIVLRGLLCGDIA